MKVLVTGAKGFVGKNLVVLLKAVAETEVFEYDIDSGPHKLEEWLATADAVFHLAGVNRPERVEGYQSGNSGFTEEVCATLRRLGRSPTLVLSSSTQALLDNPYGHSKRLAEATVLEFGKDTGAPVFVFRFPGIFGKWCRPNYNSVAATFCHNIAHDLPISISDPARSIDLVYIDDVCAAMLEVTAVSPLPPFHLIGPTAEGFAEVTPVFSTTLGQLADTIRSFNRFRRSLFVPPLDDPFVTRLYGTYLSYLKETDFGYDLDLKSDNRGGLAEFLKSASFGQIFVSHTKPGVVRGNHYHHTKTEKFFVVQGEAVIRFRHILEENVIDYLVSGGDYKVVDIPPGYTHSIENAGKTDLVTLFWADAVFDPEKPDTFYENVIKSDS